MLLIDDDIYIHPDAASSVLPHLKVHLPYASTELYVVEVPPAPDSTVLATFPPTESLPHSRAWAVGVLGITGRPETEFWFWSSAEGVPTTNGDEDGEEPFRMAYAQLQQMLKFISDMYPEKETLLVGSLHSRIASHIPTSSRDRLSPIYTKLAFSKDFLSPPSSQSQSIVSRYTFKGLAVDDLDEVVQISTSTILRSKTTLAAASNTGAYLVSSEERRAQAWCFISRDGAISTVYVKPEARGMGLGKETVKELEKAFVHRHFVMVDVWSTNTASLRLCQSLGARRGWDVVWVSVRMNQFRGS